MIKHDRYPNYVQQAKQKKPVNTNSAISVSPPRNSIVDVSLWTLMAVSSFVFIEPAPFDLIAAALMLTLFARGLRIPAGLDVPMLLMGVFVLTNIVSIIFATQSRTQPLPYMVFYATLTVYLIALWLFFTCLIASDPKRVLRIIWNGYIVAAIIAVTLGLAGYFHLVPNYEIFLKMGRAKGAFKDANVYGPFLIPVALFLLADMKGRSVGGNVLRGAIFLYFVIGLLLAFSRGAWANFVISALVFGTLYAINARSLADYSRIGAAAAVTFAATIVLVAVALSNPLVGDMFERRASLLQSYDVEAGGRFSTQRAAIEAIAENPVGLGPNRTQSELGRVPHNVYLKIAAENGWLGIVVFLAFIGVTLWRGWWFALRPTPIQGGFIAAYASTVGIVAESVIIDTMHWRHFFLLLAMIWGPMVAYDRVSSRNSPLR